MKCSVKVNDVEITFEDLQLSGYNGEGYYLRTTAILKQSVDHAIELLKAREKVI